MSEQYQRVEPTPFDAPTPARSPVQDTSEAARSKWLIPALAGLALAVLVVVFVLPSWVEDKPDALSDTVSAAPQKGAAAQPVTAQQERPATNSASPFADAVEAKARGAAQELLAELLDVQEGLVERGAETWSAEAMTAIAAQALQGDEQYRTRAFEEAIASYTDALNTAVALEGSIPERFEEQLAAVIEAIESLDVTAAETALEAATTLEPAAEDVNTLRERVAALPAVSESVSLAAEAEAADALPAAVERMGNAATLDAAHRFVASELARLRAALTEQRFNTAMSEGYAALDNREFSKAGERFETARKLSPGSAEVASAVQELSAARTVATLNSMQSRGEILLDDEDWSGATKVFREALTIDASLRFAREGLAVAEPRALLQKDLAAIIDTPARLVDDAVLREASATLAGSQALENIGPKMRTQINAAEKILSIASTPIGIRLRSDGVTAVTVYKVARLGTFEEQSLSLRPGKYTAVGTRRGYRDVRVIFEVGPAEATPIYIACDELI